MTNRKEEMKTIFDRLTEKNKEIMLLVAKGMKAAQEGGKPTLSQAKPTV